MNWHDFEATVVPIERVAKAIVRECRQELERDAEAIVHDDRELERLILANEQAFAGAWNVTVERLRTVIKMPDRELAPQFLATVNSQRAKAQDRGDLDPELDPAWQRARAALVASARRDGEAMILRKAELQAAVKAAKGQWIVVSIDGNAVGRVAKRRVRDELRTLPETTEWRVTQLAWSTRWTRKTRRNWQDGGLHLPGGLNLPLEPIPADGSQHSVWLHLDEPLDEPLDPPEPAPEPEDCKCSQMADGVSATEDDMGKFAKSAKSKSENKPEVKPEPETKTQGKPEPEPEVKPAKPTTGDLFDKLDELGLNCGCFGVNGRKVAHVRLYTRTKPSREIAAGKGSNLREAMLVAIGKLAEGGSKAPPVAATPDEDMF